MSIYVEKSDRLDVVTDFIEFNDYNFQFVDLWDSTIDHRGGYVIPLDQTQLSKSLLVLSIGTLIQMAEWPVGLHSLLNFVNNGNRIWAWDDIDSLFKFVGKEKVFRKIDQCFPKNSLNVFLDGSISSDRLQSGWENIHLLSIPYNHFLLEVSRIQNSTVVKTNCKYSYMMTMFDKPGRPHRKVLWRELQSRKNLTDQGYCTFRNKDYNVWYGQAPSKHSWFDGHASMDLYLNSWLEIVPETMYKNGHFITEKTVKPMITQTPFLVLSTCGYLDYLNKIGFKTFGSLINESYDKHYLLQDRINGMLDSLEDIIKNGTDKFYQASKSILEHNQQRLFEIKGSWCYKNDEFLQSCINATPGLTNNS